MALAFALTLFATGPAFAGEHAPAGHAAAAHHEAKSEGGAAHARTGLASPASEVVASGQALPATQEGNVSSGYLEGSNTDVTTALVKAGEIPRN